MSVRLSSYPASSPAHRQLTRLTVAMNRSMRRLSSGLRINTAADDASGLAMSERLRAQVRSIDQARRNATDGVSMLDVAERALGSVSDLLIRMRELAVQANGGTVSTIDRKTLDGEYRGLIDEIARIGESTRFNGIALLDGSAETIDFQIGTGTAAGVDTITIESGRSLMQTLAVHNSKVTTTKNANKAIKRVDRALERLGSMRGRFGSVQNRLASTIRGLSSQFESASAAESRIRDADVATELAEWTRSRILQSAALSIVAQQNVQPTAALRLLA